MVGWTADEIVGMLLSAGFTKVRQGASSHAVYRHPDGRQVTVAMHRRDIAAHAGRHQAAVRSAVPQMRRSAMPATFYPAILEAASDGYNVFFPDFDGCTSGGDTANEAVMNAAEALALHIADWSGPLPAPSGLDRPLDPEAQPVLRVLVPTPGVWSPADRAA